MTVPTLTAVMPPPLVMRRGVGPPVLLLHGWKAQGLFGPIVDRLCDRYDLIAPDLPGFGETPEPPAAWSVDEYADWVISLLDSLHIDRTRLVGHSFGGHIGIRLAARYPQRVEQLVLTGCAGLRPKRTLSYIAKVKIYKALRRLAHSRFAPDPLRRLAEREAARRGSDDYKDTSGRMREVFVRVVNEDQLATLPRITAPTLLVWGERDEATPLADGRTMERLIPDAGLVVLNGGGHYAFLEQAPYFCRVVEAFFESLSTKDQA